MWQSLLKQEELTLLLFLFALRALLFVSLCCYENIKFIKTWYTFVASLQASISKSIIWAQIRRYLYHVFVLFSSTITFIKIHYKD